MPTFSSAREVPFPVRDVFAWHMRPGALERLIPPWADARVVARKGAISDGGHVRIRVKRGPVSFDWKLRHTAFEQDRLFRDEQESGPFRSWKHSHEFEPAGKGTRLRDRIEWAPPAAPAATVFARPAVEREMKRMVAFRQRRLTHDLSRHAAAPADPLTVAVTGSSGLVGAALRHFLTTGGHAVVSVVRRKPDPARGEIAWDPMEGRIDREGLEGVDAVVHLAGESLAGNRWTPAKKQAIRRSRMAGTRVLVDAVNRLRRPPRVLVSASAVGFYGNRGNERVTEASRPGRGFLPDLCREWEAEAAKAERSGVRVVLLRTGLVLSPAGGALGSMLLPFKLGVGGRLGTGRQFVSWIDHDDLLGLVLHAVTTPSLRGPVNATAPHPVSNATFATALGRTLGRPSLVPAPSLAVKAMFGEMGQALLLHGARVLPGAAQQSGFRFHFEGVEESLAFQLGRLPAGQAASSAQSRDV